MNSIWFQMQFVILTHMPQAMEIARRKRRKEWRQSNCISTLANNQMMHEKLTCILSLRLAGWFCSLKHLWGACAPIEVFEFSIDYASSDPCANVCAHNKLHSPSNDGWCKHTGMWCMYKCMHAPFDKYVPIKNLNAGQTSYISSIIWRKWIQCNVQSIHVFIFARFSTHVTSRNGIAFFLLFYPSFHGKLSFRIMIRICAHIGSSLFLLLRSFACK